MLARQYLRRGDEGDLATVGDRGERCVDGHGCLSRADIRLQQSVHRVGTRQIRTNVRNGAVLAGLILGTLEAGSSYAFNATIRDIVAYLVLFAVLVVRPAGLLGKRNLYQ